MTTDAVSAAIVPPRPAWRSLLWIVPFTVLWTWLIYSLAGDSGERRSDPGPPADGPWAHRARLVARPRKHRPDAGPTPHDLAGDHDPGHALVRCRLERGHQWRLPHGRLTLTVAAIGDLPAGDHRRAAAAVVEAGGAGARCDAGDLARRSSALPRIRQPWLSLPGCVGRCPAYSRCRRELAMC